MMSLLPALAMAIDEPAYTVVLKDGRIELRRYASYVVVETTERDSSLDVASNAGFRKLFRYISGANGVNSEIAMTAPVITTPSRTIPMTAPVVTQNSGEGFTVGFVMPKEFTASTTPVPNDTSLRVRTVPERTVAVIRFSGRWTDANMAERQQELEQWMSSRSLRAVGHPVIARYDPPIMPWFLRRNEIQIPLAE